MVNKYECQGIGKGNSCEEAATIRLESFGLLSSGAWGIKDIWLCPKCATEYHKRMFSRVTEEENYG